MNEIKKAFNDTGRYLVSNNKVKTKLETIIKFHLVKLCATVRYPEVIQLNKYFDSLYSSNQLSIISKVILNPNYFPIPICIELYSKLFDISNAQFFTIGNNGNISTSPLESVLPIIISFLTSNDNRNCYNLRNLKDSDRSFGVFCKAIIFCEYITNFLRDNYRGFSSGTACSISILLCLSIIFDVDEEITFKMLNYYLTKLNDSGCVNSRKIVDVFLLMYVQPNYQYSAERPKFMEDLKAMKIDEKSCMDGLFNDIYFSCYDNSPFWSIITAFLNKKVMPDYNSTNDITTIKVLMSESLFPTNEKTRNEILLDNGNQITVNVELVKSNMSHECWIELEVTANQQLSKYQISQSESLDILVQYNNDSDSLYDQCIASTLGMYGADQIDEAFASLSSTNSVSLEVALSCFFERPALD